MQDQLKKFIPTATQSPKELARMGANAFFFLFLAQAGGVDLTKIGLSPTINVWVSGALFLLFGGVVTWISNHQEQEKNGGPEAQPPES